MRRTVLALVCFLLACNSASSATIEVLSAGAVEPGIVAAAQSFRQQTGDDVKIRFATAPALRQRIGAGEAADVVIAPPAVIEELAKAGKVDSQARVPVGRVGVGVAVREGAPVPDISNADAFKRMVLEAESLVYNRASTGIYLEGLLARLGVADQVQTRTTRYPDGAAVMEHLIKGTGREVGFGAATEIMLYRDKGLRLVGMLPAELQNYTSYAAAPVTGAANAEGARAFLRFLGSPDARSLFIASGID